MSARVNPMLEDLDDDPIALDAPQREAEEVRVSRAKVSVALAPKLYHFLVEFCAGATRGVGSRVTHVDVMRALLTEMSADEQLRTRVLARLRDGAHEQMRK
jgi:hypothetical protein